MMILKEMECREAGFVVVFVILLFSLAMADSEEKQNTITTFFDNEGGGGGRITLQIHEKMAEQAWIHCRKELIDKEEFDSYLPNAVSKMMNSELLMRRRRYKSVEGQPLYDCLKRRNILVSRSREEGKSWFIKCLQLVFSWPTSPRRELISKSRPILAPSSAPSPSPSPSPSPDNAPLPSPDNAPLPSVSAPVIPPSPDLQPPVEAPVPLAPSHWIDDDMAPPPKRHPPLPQATPLSKKQEAKNMATIAATTGGAVIVMSLILCCCIKNNADQLDNGKKDDKPLLILSTSDFSAGSSQNSFGLGNSSIREFSPSSGKNPAFASSLSIKPETNTSMAEAQSCDAIPAVPFPPLKLPPGRSASQPPVPPAPPPPPAPAPSPPPPPPQKAACPPPLPPKTMPGRTKLPSSVPHSRRTSASSEGKNDDDDSASQKAKLKPFFWDKVLTNPDQSMVWHDISSGSFQFSEEMIESLFSYANVNNNKTDRRKDPSSLDPSIQYIQIIDPKKAQNLSILLRALNVTTEDVVDALKEGNELPVELLQTLLKMAPTTEEELKLRLFTGDLSQLGPAERFLKVLVDIPFAFKRIDSLLFRCSLQEEISGIKESFATLEVACKKLRNSRLFLKLLEAVLKTGNRMNDGTYRGSAQAFKLDTLLKLADVKGADGKTTLLHFVVQEIIRSEGVRAARTAKESQSISSINSGEYSEDLVDEAAEHYRKLGLQVVSGLSTELEDVKKASVIDPDSLKMTVSRLCNSHIKIREFLENEMQSLDEKSEFYHSLASFVAQKEPDIMEILEEEKRIRSLVKSTGDYFHGNSGKDEGLRLFAIVRDFLFMLDKSCKEVSYGAITTTMKRYKKDTASVENGQPSDIRIRLFPVIAGRRMDESSSDDESSSPSLQSCIK